MTQAHQGDRRDLFDFPEVDGLEEFGLVPPVPEQVLAEAAADAPPRTRPAAATAPPPSRAPDDSDDVEISPARPNPPIPSGILELDEDLFTFDEIFSLEQDPYFNGTLTLDGSPTNPLFLDDASSSSAAAFGDLEDDSLDFDALDDVPNERSQPAPRPVPAQSDLASDPQRPIQPVPDSHFDQKVDVTPVADATLPESFSPAPRQEPIPARPAAAPERTRPETARPAPALMDATAAPAGTTTLDRGPRMLLPEDVPYSRTGERQRYVLALIACFLLVNTGIFFLAQQASSSFNSTMAEATGLLAEALADRTDAPSQASAPVVVPRIEHTIEAPAAREQPPFQPENWVDPTNYKNTHEFAVGNAKALLTEGRFEDARRLLNHVLANQARIPLKPSLREEIDYLIPLTYYEQGNATALEEGQ